MAIFYNQATLSYSGGTVSSNVAAGEIIEALSVTKTALTGGYSEGSVISYVINIVNSGNTDYTVLTLNDDLGSYSFAGHDLVPLTYVDGSVRYFADGVLQPDPSVTADSGLSVTGISVPAEGVAAIIYTVTANAFAPQGPNGSVTNNAVLSGAGISSINASATVNAISEPILEIIKTVSPTAISGNGRLTYTFVIQNNGGADADAQSDIVMHDTFDPLLSDISVTYNGAEWSSPENYSYNGTTGEFSTVQGAVTVPAATFSQDPYSGEWKSVPGTVTLTVTGSL